MRLGGCNGLGDRCQGEARNLPSTLTPGQYVDEDSKSMYDGMFGWKWRKLNQGALVSAEYGYIEKLEK